MLHFLKSYLSFSSPPHEACSFGTCSAPPREGWNTGAFLILARSRLVSDLITAVLDEVYVSFLSSEGEGDLFALPATAGGLCQ